MKKKHDYLPSTNNDPKGQKIMLVSESQDIEAKEVIGDYFNDPDKVNVTLCVGNIIGRHNSFMWYATSKSVSSKGLVIDGKSAVSDMNTFWPSTGIVVDSLATVQRELHYLLDRLPFCQLSILCAATKGYLKVTDFVTEISQQLPSIGGTLYSITADIVQTGAIRTAVNLNVNIHVEREKFSAAFAFDGSHCVAYHEINGDRDNYYGFNIHSGDNFVDHFMSFMKSRIDILPAITEL